MSIRSVSWPRHVLGLAGIAVATGVLAACGGSDGLSAEEAQAQQERIAALESELGAARVDARMWEQLTSLLQPVELKSMTDHRAYALPNGHLIALHFDNMDLSQAENLNWVALGIPGRFCREDQQRIEQEYGSGFTHFHDLAADVHGGEPGVEGVWFVHVAVRDLEAPWGQVSQGIDAGFMPTEAPSCDA